LGKKYSIQRDHIVEVLQQKLELEPEQANVLEQEPEPELLPSQGQELELVPSRIRGVDWHGDGDGDRYIYWNWNREKVLVLEPAQGRGPVRTNLS
jgi:hypothetical protein